MADIKITIIDKATHASTVVTGQEVSLSAASIVQLPVSHAQIKSLARQGSDLVITTVDGDTIVVHGYFADGQNGNSDLVVQDEGGLWLADLSSIDALPLDTPVDPMAGGVFSSIDSVNPLLGPLDPSIVTVADAAPAATTGLDAGPTDVTSTDPTEAAPDSTAAVSDTAAAADGSSAAGGAATNNNGSENDLNWLPLAYAGLGFATALGVATGVFRDRTPQVAEKPKPPTFGDITQNTDGTLTVTGTATAGDTVKVTFPDGTSVTTTVKGDGSYEVTSQDVQTTGDLTAIDTNPQGVNSDPTIQHWVDTTPPAPPEFGTVTTNPDGTVTITGGPGSAEPGSTINVHWPDGSSSHADVGGDGSYQVTSPTPQPDGTITITDSDKAGNESPPVSQDYVQGDHGVTITAVVRDTGESPSDFITDDNTLVFVGGITQAVPAGGSVKISLDGGNTWHPVAANGSNWSFDNTTSTIADGTYQVVVQEQDSAGKALGSYVKTLLVDTVAPTEDIAITSATSASISGTLSEALNTAGGSNEYVQVSTDGGRTWHTATVDGATWTYTPANPLYNGSYTVEARVIDVAGNIGRVAIAQETITDGQNPPLISITAIAQDTGLSSDDFITSDQTLIFTGTLSQALVNGQTAQISLDGGQSWHAVVVNGTAWTYDNTGTTMPEGTYTIEAEVIDSAGSPVGSVASQTLVIDTTAPTEAITITDIITNTGPVGGFTTGDNSLVFVGQVNPALNTAGGSNEYVQVSLDGGKTWHDATVSGNTWTYDNTANLLPDGSFQLEARIIDAAGNVDPNIATQTVTIQNGQPPILITIDAIVSDTGASPNDFITDDNTLVFIGSLKTALASGQSVQISLDGGNSWQAANVNGTTWTYDNTDNPPLADGSYLVEARIVDSASTPVGLAASQTVVIDTTAPTETVTITGIISDTDPNVTDFSTSDNTLVFVGQVNPSLNTAGSGSKEYVQVSLDGGSTWHDAALSGNTWTYDNTANVMPDGDYLVEARIVDVAGNIDPNIATQMVNIHGGVPPTITIGAIISDTGLSPNDFITKDPTLIFSGKLAAALGTGERAQISLDGGSNWTDVSTNGTTWAYDNTGTPLSDSSYNVQARVLDSAGHQVGAIARQAVVVDTTPPSEAISITNIITDNGASNSDFLTSDNTLVFMGKLNPTLNGNGGSNEYVQVSFDGGKIWHDATVSGNTWTYDNTGVGLKDGDYLLEARILDVAGNIDPNIASQTVSIRGGSPIVTIDSVSPDDGLLSNDFITDKGSLTFSGTVAQLQASSGVSVQVSLDGGKSWQSASLTGTAWTFSTANLTDGTYSVLAKIVDGSGRQVGPYAQQTLVVDTQAPTEAVTIDGIVNDTNGVDANGAFVTSDQTLDFYGSLSQPLNTQGGSLEYVRVSIDGGDWQIAAVSGTQWHFDYTDTSLSNGTHKVTAQVVDVAGNVGKESTATVIVQNGTNITPQSGTIAITYISQDAGVSSTDFITNVNQQTINGTVSRALQTGESIQVSLDGGATWNDATWNNTALTWAYATPVLADGAYLVEARISIGGNAISGQEASQLMVIDTLPPTETITVTGGGPLPVQVNADGTISGTISSPLATSAGGVSQELLQVQVLDVNGNTTVSWINATTSGTNWTATLPTSIGSGLYTLNVRIIDTAGNTDTFTVTQPILVGRSQDTLVTIDSITPDTGPSSSDFVTNSSQVAINGHIGRGLVNGETLWVTTNGGNSWVQVSTAAISGSTWSYSPGALADGTYLLQAEIRDATGAPVSNGVSTSQSLVIDTIPPIEVVSITSAANFDTGTPTFGGTISAVLANGTQSGVSSESLRISLDGGNTWNNATVNGNTWSYTPNLPLANGTYNVQVQVVDLAGNLDPQIAKQTVEIGGGSTPILITAITPDTGVSTTTDTVITNPYLNGGTGALTVSGTIFAPLTNTQSIQVSMDGGVTWSTLPASSVNNTALTWSYVPNVMPTDGTYTVQAQIVNGTGSSNYVNSKTLIIDTHAPSETALITSISQDTGTSGADFVTNVSTQTISGTLSAPLGSSGGSAESLQISLNGGNTWVTVPSGNIITGPSGTTWSYSTATLYPNGLADSSYKVETRVTDQAGNVGPISSQTVVIDTHAPGELPAITSISNPTSSTTPWVTNNGAVTIYGTLSSALTTTTTAGGVSQEYLQISLDGGKTWTTIPNTNITIDPVTGAVSWSYAVPDQLQAGSYQVQVQVADIAGNVGHVVTQQVAVGNPNETISNIVSIQPDRGPSDSDMITNTNAVTLSGTLTKISDNSTPTSLTATQVVQVSVDGGANWTTVPGANVSGSQWSYAVQLLQSNGDNTVETRVYDTQGNTWSTPTSVHVLVDIIPPTEGIAITAISPDTGGNFTTSNGALTISGTLTKPLNLDGGSTEIVQVSTDGGQTWNQATVAPGSTEWHYTPATALVGGSYKVIAEVVDTAGNVGQSASQTVIVNSTAPSETASFVGTIPDTGLEGDFITSTLDTGGQITIQGKLSAPLAAGDSVQISTDNGINWINVTSVNGTAWNYVTSSLGDGTYQLQARVVSASGVGNSPATQKLIIDNLAPDEIPVLTAVTGGVIADDGSVFVTPSQAPVLSGTLVRDGSLNTSLNPNGSTEMLAVSLDGGKTWGEATVAGSSWTYDTSGLDLAPGSYTVTLEVVDLAGNIGPVRNYTLELNTVPKEGVTINSIDPDTGAKGDWITATAAATVSGGGGTGALTVNGTVSSPLQANEGVRVSLDGGKSWTQATVNGTSWSVVIANVGDGNYTITAETVNTVTQAGGTPTTQDVTVDNTAPAEVPAIVSITRPEGSQGLGFVTSTPDGVTLNGTLSEPLNSKGGSHESLQISVDAGKTWVTLDTNTSSPTHNGTYDPTTGNWSYFLPKLADGDNQVAVQVVDDADNTSTQATQTVVLAIPPTFTNLTFGLDRGNDDGVSTTDNVTSIAAPVIVGTVTTTDPSALAALAKGTLVATIYVDSNGDGIPDAGDLILGTGKVQPDRTFTVDLASMAPGSYTLQAAIGHDGVYSVTQNNVNFVNSAGTAAVNKLTIVSNVAAETYTQPTQTLGLGYAMSAIGDFNGDGYTDYIVSAPRDLRGPAGSTTATVEYLLYGGPSGLPNVGNVDTLLPSQGFKITNTGPWLNGKDKGLEGLTVTDVGDLNGDGLSDVVISSNLNDRAYVLFGQRGNNISSVNLSSLEATATSQGFVIRKGSGGGNYVGDAVTGADINGDGYSDLLISSPSTGKMYVIYGHSGTWNNYNITSANGGSVVYADSSGKNGAVASNAATIKTPSGSIWAGGVLNAVGDVNGDGYQDFVVTVPNLNVDKGNLSGAQGAAVLVFGTPGGFTLPSGTSLTSISPSQGIFLSSSQKGEALGGKTQSGANGQQGGAWYAQYHSVTTLGDINGDGYTDFAIGSPGAINPTSNGDGAGAVYVIYGTAAGTNWSNISLPTYGGSTFSSTLANKGFVIYSQTFANKSNGKANNESSLGYSVSNVGDVNGDGVDDFMIGAPMANSGAGAAFLVFGQAGGLPGAASGVVNLDTLVAAGKVATFGTPGTAIEYDGTSGGGTSAYLTNTYMGTDVTGGDFTGSGLSSYSFSSWNDGNGAAKKVANNGQGEAYVYNGTAVNLTQSYTAGDDILYAGVQGNGNALIGNTGNRLVGGLGNDWIHGIGQQLGDVAYGGAGDDSIGIVGTQFQRVDGGSGWNTLVFESSGMTLNLPAEGAKVQNFQVFDLNNQTNNTATDPQAKVTGLTHANTLVVTLADVLKLTQEVTNENATSKTTERHVTILGDETSIVSLEGTTALATAGTYGWQAAGTQTVNGVTFTVYHNNVMGATNTAADLLIQQGVHVV